LDSEEIQRSAASGELVIVFGAGSSMSLTQKSKRALNWSELVISGLEYGRSRGLIEDSQFDVYQKKAKSNVNMDLLESADYVSAALRGTESYQYECWLASVFEDWVPDNCEMLNALKLIGRAQIPLATLNFDTLIEQATGRPGISPTSRTQRMRWLRGKHNGILHLHGDWEHPDSCVFGTVDYRKILDDELKQSTQQWLASIKRILFVGCGGTFYDPNFSRLIEWVRKNIRAHQHLALVLEDEVEQFMRDRAWHGFIKPLSFGKKYADLPGFLLNCFSQVPARAEAERIPYEKNAKEPIPKGFTAREYELKQIHRYLRDPKSNERTPPLVAISGMPGLGKTSIAAAYAKRFADAYDGVLWFNAARRAVLAEGIAELGEKLHPRIEVTDEGEGDERLAGAIAAAEATLARLDGSGDTILYVYDNVERPQDIDGLMPRSPNARILLTSRFPDWAHGGRQIIPRFFTVEQARDFLLTGRQGDDVDVEGATAVAEALRGLPLALSHARKYCQTAPFEQFLERYRNYLDKAPNWDSQEELSVFASMMVVLDVAAGKCPHAVDLLETLSFCAPDHIPYPIYDGLVPDSGSAIDALSAVSLVTFTSDRRTLSIHRLVQDAVRARAEKYDNDTGSKRASAAFGRMARRLLERSSKVTTKGSSESSLLTPHLLSLIEHIHEDWLEEVGDALLLDRLATMIVLAILYAPNSDDMKRNALVAPKSLVRVLGMFYEVEPLVGALVKLIEARSAQWPELLRQFLGENNYVLRHALAQALGGSILRGMMEFERATELLRNGRSLEEFEVGGYALGLVYATDPDRIEPDLLTDFLTKLAEHPCYPGRSILGDLILNLAFDDNRKQPLPEFPSSERFWRSHWDYIRLDADAARAVEDLLTGAPTRQAFGTDSPAGEDLDFFRKAEARRQELIRRNPTTEILKLLQDYRRLGREPDCIRNAEGELAESDDLADLMWLFFAHPQWSVAEAAATILARIIGSRLNKGDYIATEMIEELVTNLFDSKDWRIRFGAAEASYALHQDDGGVSFELAVRTLYRDENCKVRGLCAENLGSIILNASPEGREGLLKAYYTEISYWLCDQDCWVLEHVHRLFSQLRGSGLPTVAALRQGPVSPLFAGLKDWTLPNRTIFLKGIERCKEQKHKEALACLEHAGDIERGAGPLPGSDALGQ